MIIRKKNGKSTKENTKKRMQNLELDKKRQFNATQHRTVKQKRRRIELKEQRIRNDTSAEVHEGKTYETAIDSADDITPDDIVEIPPPLLPPSIRPSVSAPQPDTLIVFDIETTGLAHDSDKIQLSAMHLDSGDTFSAYMRPAGGRIPNTITSLTGIEIHGEEMFYNMTPVGSTDVFTGLSTFSEWLKKFKNPVLIALNAGFDTRVLINSFLRCSVSHSHIHGFADSLKLCRAIFPGQSCYKLSAIVQNVLKIDFNAHKAEADVAALGALRQTVDASLRQTVDALPQKLQILAGLKMKRTSCGHMIFISLQRY
ncbi:uncharacterized protein LOC128225673 [Mya arenaria]|uniref:uncharacterized protein LOC128225673 n=1 Tax=Mya arenaria TaxID=6604 RepID=UPI0022E6F598|nr:uncharacterized protein LOC128225673 [Mya arenaria]